MYPAVHAESDPDRTAVVMAASGARLSYAELDDRSARLADVLRRSGLARGDTVVLALPNDLRWAEVLWACLRSGLVCTPVNWHLGAAELAPMMADAQPAAVVAAADLLPAVRAAVAAGAPAAEPLWLAAGAGDEGVADYDGTVAAGSRDPDRVDTLGATLLFSSGTTGRPKPIRGHPVEVHPAHAQMRLGPLMRRFGFDDPDVTYLSTGPAYHAAPLGFLQCVHQLGGTVVLMERFDPEAALAAIQRYRVTHSLWVPTMFVRLLRLPEEVRQAYDLSSHRVAVHGAAPCTPAVKRAMLQWWGPIVHEYYGASEGFGTTAIGPEEWLARPGSVGRATTGTPHICDDEGRELVTGEVGTVWFERSGAGWGTAGDLGRLGQDGYLYLTGRASEVIISGGVNIHPREVEHVLAEHPAVCEAAVFGVPDEEFGERVTAVVEVATDHDAGPELEAALIARCRGRLAGYKCPRAVDFTEHLPRSEVGKVLVGSLRERYR